MLVLRETYPAMGSTAEVVVVGGDAGHLALARRSIEHLEACWSRFLPDSDISRLNRAGGRSVVVDGDTSVLLAAMHDGRRATAGAFDPTLLDALESAGYAAFRTRHERWRVSGWPEADDPDGHRARASAAGTGASTRTATASVPPGTTLDAGGIGKGLAADLTVRALLGAGAAGALVGIGGDLRVAGESPQPGGWAVAVRDPGDDEHALLRLLDGGVATSGTTRRAWRTGTGRTAHHVIDPRSGRPLDPADNGGAVQATVLCGTAAWAEVWATAALVRGLDDGPAELQRHGIPVRMLRDDGSVVTNEAWSRYVAREVA